MSVINTIIRRFPTVPRRRAGRRFRHALLAAAALPPPAAATPMTLQQYLALDGPPPTVHIAYGPAKSQYAELFQPPGPGPFPVVLLIHGGCWQTSFGGITQMHAIAGALQAEDIAVWNVEYRRVDEPGGGYPGSYRDIIAALHTLAADAPTYHLDTTRIVAVGHSAGAYFVQWLAGRAHIPPSSPLYETNPLPIRHIIALGGGLDQRDHADHTKQLCDVDRTQLNGTPAKDRPDILSDTNPTNLLPTGSHTVMINGDLDHQVPPALAADYAAAARQAGDDVETITVPNASHFDEVAPTSAAWPALQSAIHAALRLPPALSK